MQRQFWGMLAAVVALAALSGCVPLVVAGGVVVADEIAENRHGGDGLF